MLVFLSLLKSRIGKAIASVVVALAVIVGLIRYGASKEKEALRVDKLEDYIRTTKEINDVENSSDDDAAIKRLRDNGYIR